MKLLYVFPLLAGFCVSLQGTINGHWESRIGVHATIIINTVIATVCTIVLFMVGNQTPYETIKSEFEPWVMLNGVCGFTIIVIAALTFPRIGAASVIVLMVAAQLATAVTLDHFGVLSLPKQPVSMLRILGIAFVLVGVFLTTRG